MMYLYWIDFSGRWKYYQKAYPGKWINQGTYTGHRWVVKYYTPRPHYKYFYTIKRGGKCWKPPASKKSQCWKKAKYYSYKARVWSRKGYHYKKLYWKHNKYAKNHYAQAKKWQLSAIRHKKTAMHYKAKMSKSRNHYYRYYKMHMHKSKYAWKKSHSHKKVSYQHKRTAMRYKHLSYKSYKYARHYWKWGLYFNRKCFRISYKKKAYCKLGHKWVKK